MESYKHYLYRRLFGYPYKLSLILLTLQILFIDIDFLILILIFDLCLIPYLNIEMKGIILFL